MKKENLNDAMNFLDPSLIEEAAPGKRRKTGQRTWVRVLAVAATLAVLLAAVPISMLIANRGWVNPPSTNQPKDKAGLLGENETYPIVEVNDYVSVPQSLVSHLNNAVFVSNREKGSVSEPMRESLAELSLALLRACRAKNGEDMLISPLSIQTALAMAANGAQGETLAQMLRLLAPGMTQEELNQQFFNLYAGLRSGEGAKLEASNSIWSNRDGFLVSNGFLDVMNNTFQADIFSADFSDAERIASEINRWCEEKTDGMIPEIIKPEDVDDDDLMMVLLNALCFDAAWSQPFTKVTLPGIFHTSAGDREITMMTGDADEYLQDEQAIGFIKHYKGNYGFMAILPNKGVSLESYLASLDGAGFRKLFDSRKDAYVIATMPIFENDCCMELNDILSAMGMRNAFDPFAADFTRLGMVTTGDNVFISRVLHKTHIEVNEVGTRAAAVTEVDIYCGTVITTPINVYLNRPFLYAIVDMTTGTPLFLGTCENPQLS